MSAPAWRELDGLASRGGGLDVGTLGPEQDRDDLADVGDVLDHQHAQAGQTLPRIGHGNHHSKPGARQVQTPRRNASPPPGPSAMLGI